MSLESEIRDIVYGLRYQHEDKVKAIMQAIGRDKTKQIQESDWVDDDLERVRAEDYALMEGGDD